MICRTSDPSRRFAAPLTRVRVAWGHRRGCRRNRCRDEGGAVIIIVAVLLTGFMAAGALTIDLSAGRQSETKAQSAADASATAAADFIPVNPSASNPTGAALQALTTAATTMATQNGACPTCVTVQYPYKGTDYSRVLVSVSGSSSGTLGGASGRASIPVSASAVAAAHTSQTVNQTPTSSVTNSLSTTVTNSVSSTVTQSTTLTVNPGTNQTPSAIFAHDTTCGDNPLTIASTLSSPYGAANNVNLQGSIYSNGNIGLYYSGSNGNFGDTISYGPRCAITGSTGGNYNGGQPAAAATTYPYPHDYSQDTIPCDQSAPTYSWSGTDLNISGTGTYCATSSITINLSGNLNATGVTFVAPKITIAASNCVLSPDPGAPSQLEFYNKGTVSQTLSINCSSNLNFGGGSVFSPNAPINITSQNFNNSEFIEGYQVHIALPSGSINVAGDGAASGANSAPTPTTNTIDVTVPTTVPVTSTVTTPVTNSYTLTNTTTVPNGSALAAP
jgi:trimeric autotransporter adhesin